MAWSVTEVARISGASSRMLRHYHEIGLLVPCRVGANGYRYYEQEQLLRLQQILLLRELGLGLARIKAVLDGGGDPVEVLERHRRWLLSERDRFDELARTVSDTIRRYEEGRMEPQYMFSGFDREKLSRYRGALETHLTEKYGEEARRHLPESTLPAGELTSEQYDAHADAWNALNGRLAALAGAGTAVDAPETFDALDEHYRHVCEFWEADQQAYTGLGRLYADSDDFRRYFDSFHPALADFLRDAMAAYARARLSPAP